LVIQNSSRIDFPRNLDNVLPSLPRALELQSRSRFCHAFSSHEPMELKISKKRAESRKRRARSHATAANLRSGIMPMLPEQAAVQFYPQLFACGLALALD
jgi:hypothetical protein